LNLKNYRVFDFNMIANFPKVAQAFKYQILKLMVISMVTLFFCAYSDSIATDIDSDGDGLSDFQEIHKYFTDPMKVDSDGDGIPEGDWDERREYTYSVRSVLRFMPPFDKITLNDNFQDARIIAKNNDYIELEVIHYPFNAIFQSINENPNWRTCYAEMTEYLKPGITTNWDTKMREDLLHELTADGIIIDKLTDKQVIQQVSSWVLKKSNYIPMFTTYYIYYPNSTPKIYRGLENAFNDGKGNPYWTIQQQFGHELLGREMFYNKTHGTCTSFAVYLTTIFRAIGIPTRMIIAIPAVDPSDKGQIQLVRKNIMNINVRENMLSGLEKAGQSFTAHTFNEVYVGNTWHRLNYNKLGENILDQQLYGLITHLYTFNDLSEVNLAPTWGFRYGKGIRTTDFSHNNPYATIAISELYGKHSNKSKFILPSKK